MFLDCVVSEVDHSISQVFGGEFLAGCANVALLVPIATKIPTYCGDKHVASDVEFAFVVEIRHQVTLNDVGTFLAVGPNALVLDDITNLIHSFHHIDPAATIGILSWLDNPQCFLLVNLQEIAPLLISFLLDVVSLRNELEGTLADSQIVRLEVVIKGFFVAEVPVELEMVVDL